VWLVFLMAEQSSSTLRKIQIDCRARVRALRLQIR
jgi:hypothetical protein